MPVVYLMQSGANFRIGKAKSLQGARSRGRHQGATALWILWEHESDEIIRIAELAFQAEFGIPGLQFRFYPKLGASAETVKQLDEHLQRAWKVLGNNEAKAIAALKKFGLSLDGPDYTWSDPHLEPALDIFYDKCRRASIGAQVLQIMLGASSCR